MRFIYVPASPETRDKLVRLAQRECRDPRQQAAKLLAEAVERALAGRCACDRREAVPA